MTEAHVLLARTAKGELARAQDSENSGRLGDLYLHSTVHAAAVSKSRVSLAITFAASWQLLGTYASNRPARPALLHHS